MSAVAGPYGLRIVKMLGDSPFSGGMHSYPLNGNQGNGFYFGDPVGLVAGKPTPLLASPTTAISDNSPIGIFMGCEYQDPVRGFVNSQYLPPGAYNAGARQIKLKIADSPFLVMQIQANGPVTLDKIGSNAALAVAGLGNGNLATGNSVVALDAASIVAPGVTLAFRIYDLVVNATPSPGAGSTPGDAFTDVLVVWNSGVHRFTNSSGR